MSLDDIVIDFSKVIDADQIKGEDEEETAELNEMLAEATNYLMSFKWCNGIEKRYMGIGIPGIVGVFLFKIIPAYTEVDEWIWVIVGDLPPAYISAVGFPNPAKALDGYIAAMREWVEAVKAGEDTSDLIPVNVPPTLEWAKKLEIRLDFLEKKILWERYRNDL